MLNNKYPKVEKEFTESDYGVLIDFYYAIERAKIPFSDE
jgi:hypothetical protein